MDLETKTPVEVLDRSLEPQEPNFVWDSVPWSPDSDWVLLPLRSVLTDTLRAITPDGALHREIVPVSCMVRGGPAILCRAFLSPDGQIIAGGGRLTDEDDENLCAVNTDGTNFRVLIPSILVYDLVWSPDARSIFFMYTPRIGSSDYRYGIVNVDGSDYHDPFARLTRELGYIENVRWLRLALQPPTPTATFTAISTPRPTATELPTKALTATATPLPSLVPTISTTQLASVMTATPSPTNASKPISTPSLGDSTCTVFGAIVFVVVLGWWALNKRG